MGDEGTSGTAHTEGTRRGEEVSEQDGKEPGRHTMGTDDTGGATGTRTARDATGINPDDVDAQDPNAPRMPPA